MGISSFKSKKLLFEFFNLIKILIFKKKLSKSLEKEILYKNDKYFRDVKGTIYVYSLSDKFSLKNLIFTKKNIKVLKKNIYYFER